MQEVMDTAKVADPYSKMMIMIKTQTDPALHQLHRIKHSINQLSGQSGSMVWAVIQQLKIRARKLEIKTDRLTDQEKQLLVEQIHLKQHEDHENN